MYSRRVSPLSYITCISPIAVFFFRALLEKQIANLFAKSTNDEIDRGGIKWWLVGVISFICVVSDGRTSTAGGTSGDCSTSSASVACSACTSHPLQHFQDS
ncbi:hypothetical protein Adt_21239 [Abeliophyllum distichum]|uniref:Uncharacterized protein n=1 Tax=Abeliophyllum distichum TaxID=126358 RepID=A0ABD1SYX1_9LAMI